ncbi:MAG: OmpA family protein [Verrucomicrobiales bacterium]|nr:OmpA family protein [Verrucomicrobiales bacterium]
MKMTKLIYTLVFALAITLASTGCHNRQVKVTPIPGSRSGQVGDNPSGSTLTPGGAFDPNAGGGVGTGGGPTANAEDFENMNMDRAALAAYTIHFAFDSAAIKSSEQANLEAVAAALKSDASAKLLIEGYCDERGTEEYNRSLGERRALAAREALARDGVDPSRIRTISYGKDKPADPGHDDAAWAKNRRDEFVLLHPKAGA